MQLGVEIPQANVDALETRAHRLIVAVDKATQDNPDRRVKVAGGQLAERILEWVEEIKDLREVGDDDVAEVMRSFSARLKLAEKAVAAWPTGRSRSARRRSRAAA